MGEGGGKGERYHLRLVVLRRGFLGLRSLPFWRLWWVVERVLMEGKLWMRCDKMEQKLFLGKIIGARG